MPITTRLIDLPGTRVVQVDGRSDRPLDFGDPGSMFFRLWDPDLGTLDLTCDNGYVITDYDLGYPNVRPVAYDIALDNGQYDVTRYFGSRAVTINLALRPTSDIAGQVPFPNRSEPQLRDDLLAYLQPGRRPLLIFQEEGDSRVRQMQLRAESGSIPVSRPKFNSMSVSWVAPRGVIRSWGDNCITWEFDNAAAPVTLDIDNAGNLPAHWTAKIQGAVYQPTFELGGQSIQLAYESAPGDTIEIDSFTRRVTINGVEVGYRYIDDNTGNRQADWVLVPPGGASLVIGHGGIQVANQVPTFWQQDPATNGLWEPSGNPAVEYVWSTAAATPGNPADAAILTFCVDDVWS